MRLETGVPGFDEMLGGGLPSGRLTVVAGEPGSGIHLLIYNLVWNALEGGLSVLYFALESPPAEMVKIGEELGKEVERAREEGRLKIMDGFSVRTGIAVAAVGEYLDGVEPRRFWEVIRMNEPDLVVVDSTYPVHGSDPEAMAKTVAVLKASAMHMEIPVVIGDPVEVLDVPGVNMVDVLLRMEVHDLNGVMVSALTPLKLVPPTLPRFRVPVTVSPEGDVIVHTDRVLDVHEGEIRDADSYVVEELGGVPAEVAEEVVDSDFLEDLDVDLDLDDLEDID